MLVLRCVPMKLIIEDDEGRQTIVPFVRDEITIGRMEGNDVRLTERNVSRRHARLVKQDGHVRVEDVGSSYGIHVNGKRIREPATVGDGDLIQIGDYDLAVQVAEQSDAPLLRNRQMSSRDEDDEEGIKTPSTGGTSLEDLDLTDPGRSLSREPTAVTRSPLLSSTGAPIEEIDPAEAPRLVVLNTDFAGREYACIRTELKIGRADENDIAINHPSLGSTHARLTRTGDFWKVTDLGTSNGISHNELPCHQAELESGDLLEVGTVRFKFLDAGVPFRFDPKAEYLPPKRTGGRNKILVAVSAVLVLAGAGVLGLRYARHQPPFDAASAKHGQRPAGEAALGANSLGVAAALQQAQEAMAARKFDRAVSLLEGISQPSAEDQARIAPLLQTSRKERSAQAAVALAKDALGRMDYQGAQSALKGAETSEAFRADHDALLQQIATAQTDALYEQGRNELKTGKFRLASQTFTRCLGIDEKAARCHMLLGASYAQLASKDRDARARNGELEKAVAHYRKFLQYAGPDDAKEAAKVKAILRSYEGSRR